MTLPINTSDKLPILNARTLNTFRSIVESKNTSTLISTFDAFLNSTSEKLRRKINHYGLEFSLIKTYASDSALEPPELFIIAPIRVAEAGSTAVVKVGIHVEQTDAEYTLNFKQPYALKIIRGRAKAIPTDYLTSSAFAATKAYFHPTPITFLARRDPPYKKYLTLPLLPGEELYAFLNKKKQTLSFIQRLEIAHAIALELGKFHQLHYCHMDLKPENIIIHLSRDIQGIMIRLIDFDHALIPGNSLNKTPYGTAGFSMTSAARGQGVAKFQHDTYAFAILLIDLLKCSHGQTASINFDTASFKQRMVFLRQHLPLQFKSDSHDFSEHESAMLVTISNYIERIVTNSTSTLSQITTELKTYIEIMQRNAAVYQILGSYRSVLLKDPIEFPENIVIPKHHSRPPSRSAEEHRPLLPPSRKSGCDSCVIL
tara:strand:- start:56753 stop:58036 length:1284 start_codon:yes stop_codon:yes gene_type:complete